jgi:hypothetical protein
LDYGESYHGSKSSSSFAMATIIVATEKGLIAYATDCDDTVAKAVWEGVNLVIWSFMSIHKEESDGSVVSKSCCSLDFDCDREMIRRL